MSVSLDRPGGAVLLLALCALLCAGAIVASDRAAATPTCSQRVIADWSDNGRVDRTYPPSCYRQALQQLPEDLATYSSAPDDIQRALFQSHPGTRRTADAPALRPARAPAAGGSGDLVLATVSGLAVALALGSGLWLVWRRPRRSG